MNAESALRDIQRQSQASEHTSGPYSPSQSTPASPKHPSSILVEIGFRSLQRPNPSSANMMSTLTQQTKMANGTK